MSTAGGSSTLAGSPSIEITEICVSSQHILKSVQLSIGSFERESPCLLGAKTHKFELPSPCQLSPSESLYLKVRFRGLFRAASKNKIPLDELLNKVGHDFSGKQEWSKSFDKFNVVLKFRRYAGNSTSGDLQPTTDALFKLVERFRVLVIGSSGVGKSSLIHECFGVKATTVSDLKAGVSNINKELIANENVRFILHDSEGFEPGEGENFGKVVDFLQARKDMPNVRDQVHVVWVCFQVSLSKGDRLFEAKMEELFRMKSKGELGPVPVIAVFTKYDKLVEQVKFGNNLEFRERNKNLDPEKRNARLAEETRAKFQELCVSPFEKAVGKDIPHIAVSINKEYKDTMLGGLVRLTADCVKNSLEVDVAEDVALVSAIALRVNPAVKIDAVIAVGQKRYWMRLASSVNFSGKTIEACLRVLHTDIVRAWNIQDQFGHLESKEFMALMTTLAEELSDTNMTTFRASPLLSALTALVVGLSETADPVAIPTVALAKWADDVYEQSTLTVRRLMAYIVDFTLIMQLIFGLVANARLPLSRRLIKLAFATYKNSLERIQVHNEIRDHVKSAGRSNRDAALAKMLELINNCQMRTEDMDKLQDVMKGFDNVEDEPWEFSKT